MFTFSIVFFSDLSCTHAFALVMNSLQIEVANSSENTTPLLKRTKFKRIIMKNVTKTKMPTSKVSWKFSKCDHNLGISKCDKFHNTCLNFQ